MKYSKLAVVLIMVVSLAACAGLQLTNDANSQAMGYIAGKGMGLAINKLAPKSAPQLETAWKDMLSVYAPADAIPGAEMVKFYNKCALILVGEVNDPYGLLGDLSALGTIYGAQYAPDGSMTAMSDVPRNVADYFALGYSSGKQLALR